MTRNEAMDILCVSFMSQGIVVNAPCENKYRMNQVALRFPIAPLEVNISVIESYSPHTQKKCGKKYEFE
jgi:hypothetical protein